MRPRRAPEAVIATALNRAETGMRPGGFMLIVRQVVDEVTYNERGNEVAHQAPVAAGIEAGDTDRGDVDQSRSPARPFAIT